MQKEVIKGAGKKLFKTGGNMKKILFLLIFIFLIPFVFGEEIQIKNKIYLNLQGENLTLRSEGRIWAFNSSQNISAELNNTFMRNITYYYTNCSDLHMWIIDGFKECDALREKNSELAGAIEKCGGRNTICGEYKSKFENESIKLNACNNNINTLTTEKSTAESSTSSCISEKNNMYSKTNVYWLIGILLVGAFYLVKKNPGRPTDYKQLDKKRIMPDSGNINLKQMDEEMTK